MENDLLYEISPPQRSRILRQMARPSPVPLLFVVKFGVNSLFRFSSLMPGPLSSTTIS